jgi:hypothetical protein
LKSETPDRRGVLAVDAGLGAEGFGSEVSAERFVF